MSGGNRTPGGPSAGGPKNDDPGVIQDWETRKALNTTKEDIKKSSILIWVSIGAASLGLVLIMIAWISLTMKAPATVKPVTGPATKSPVRPTNTNDSQTDEKISALERKIGILNGTLSTNDIRVDAFKTILDLNYTKLDGEFKTVNDNLETLSTKKTEIETKLTNTNDAYKHIWESEKCGKTTKLETYRKGSLICSRDKPCQCYGKICLQGKLKGDTYNSKCNEGNVYVDGEPVCNSAWGSKGGAVVCKALGFYDQQRTRKDPGKLTKYFQTTCKGYEAEITQCGNLVPQGVCENNKAYLICKRIED